MSALSPLPNLSRRAAATFARYDAENDFETREQSITSRERRVWEKEKQLQARSDEISERERAAGRREGTALEQRVEATLAEGRAALGLDTQSREPFRNDLASAHNGATARAILAAGAARKNPGAPPLPVDGVARAIVLCGQLRRGEITDEEYAALLNGRAK